MHELDAIPEGLSRFSQYPYEDSIVKDFWREMRTMDMSQVNVLLSHASGQAKPIRWKMSSGPALKDGTDTRH